MKTMKPLFTMALLCAATAGFSQVQINKPIELTGGTGERLITNLELPVNGTDATNKDYVDAAVAAGGGGGSSKPEAISVKSGAQMSQKDATQYCEALVESGKDDWRLPTFSELSYFNGSTTDSDFLWSKTKSNYEIATNQNYVSARLNDGKWSDGGVISRFLPRTISSGYALYGAPWTTVLTITPTVGDVMLLPDFSLSQDANSSGGALPQHQMIITFADGGTLTLGPYTSSTSTIVRYTFTARDMEEAWMFGPIQQIEVQQSATTGYTGNATVNLASAYEVILSQSESGSGLYTRCVR